MQEEVKSSQEVSDCSLPLSQLSQEDFDQFFRGSVGICTDADLADLQRSLMQSELEEGNASGFNSQNVNNQIDPCVDPSVLPNQSFPGVLPIDFNDQASQHPPVSKSWLGEYSFNIYFEDQEKAKGLTWIYSRERDKLYVTKGAPCCINFITKPLPPQGAVIRVKAIYKGLENANEVVKRCCNHALETDSKVSGDIDFHLIHCDSKQAWYDNNSKHLSVLVPYEFPTCDTFYTSYVFKFFCFSSCFKRPIKIVFSLEVGSQEIGRRCLDVKICACPSRDCRIDNNKQKKDYAGYKDSVLFQNRSTGKKKRKSKECNFMNINPKKKLKIKNEISWKDEISSALDMIMSDSTVPNALPPTIPGYELPMDHPIDGILVDPPVFTHSLNNNFTGEYEFNIEFLNEKSRGPNFIYSERRDKLYTMIDSPCAIGFRTKEPVPEGMRIRVCAVFAKKECASSVVERCLNHIQEDFNNGVSYPNHFIRCESDSAIYDVDSQTHRMSVLVPFQNPPDGEQCSVYVFKFKCYSSCKGLDRKPIKVVFRLERGTDVVGQRSLAVKICSCPVRDCRNEDNAQTTMGKSNKVLMKPQEKAMQLINQNTSAGCPEAQGNLCSRLSDILRTSCRNSNVERKLPKNVKKKNGYYILTVADQEEKEFLMNMAIFYNLLQKLDTLNYIRQNRRETEQSQSDSTEETE